MKWRTDSLRVWATELTHTLRLRQVGPNESWRGAFYGGERASAGTRNPEAPHRMFDNAPPLGLPPPPRSRRQPPPQPPHQRDRHGDYPRRYHEQHRQEFPERAQ